LVVCGKELRIDRKLIRIGFIDGEGYQFLDNLEEALEAIRNSPARIDVFTFIQKLAETTPKYAYPLEWDNIAALPVSSFDAWWTQQVDSKTRNMVRKAEKNGVVVREVPFDNALVEGIWKIYNESPIRQGKRFTHYGEDLETVRRVNATFLERSIFIGAFLSGELIGFVKLVANEDHTQAGLMQIVSMIQHRDKAPTNALTAQAVRSCAQRGISYLWYANFSYGNKQRDGLSDFKRHNGFQKIELPRYYVPLSPLGHIGLRLGLHRSLHELIPGPALRLLLKLRSKSYQVLREG